MVRESVASGYSRYVGRVGALAVALGVGSAIASVPTGQRGEARIPVSLSQAYAGRAGYAL